MTYVRVRKQTDRNPWLVTICVLLSFSTIGFGLLAVRNAKPFDCQTSFINNNGQVICQRVLNESNTN